VEHSGDYVVERLGGLDLVVGCPAQQRFDGSEVVEDAAEFGR